MSVLLVFSHVVSCQDLADQLGKVFQKSYVTNNADPEPYMTLVGQNDQAYLYPYADPKPADGWAEGIDGETFASLVTANSFIEYQYQTLEQAKKVLPILCMAHSTFHILMNGELISGAELLRRLQLEPLWDWRDYEANPWLIYPWCIHL